MVIDQARQRIDDLDRADQLIVMLGAVTHDFGKPATTAFIDGRIRSLNHEEEGVAPAVRVSRSPQHSLDRRQGRARAGARPRRAPSEARHALQGARTAHRRRVPPPRAESQPRAARARREIRLPRPRPAISIARRWTGFSSARASSAWIAARRSRCCSADTCSSSA